MHEYNRIKNAYPFSYAELSPLTDRCRTMAFSYLYYGYRALRQYLDAVQNFIFECQRLRLPTIYQQSADSECVLLLPLTCQSRFDISLNLH